MCVFKAGSTVPHISAVLPLRAHLHCMSIDRANLGGIMGNFFILIYILTHPYIYVQRGSMFPYYIPKGYCFVSEILLTSQMTGTRQHEDSTTLRLQPRRTAAVVGYIMYVHVASPRYAEASCCRLREGTILNRTTIKTIQRIFS